jgi:AcrR family transcriptional regulator
MDINRKSAANGKDRLLDAAEQLFAHRGYDGASVRAITRLAGVELGLASYHFGTKDELYRQVVLRRAPTMAGDLDAALKRALPAKSLEAIYDAFARTHLSRLHDNEVGWRNYIRLAADIALKGHEGRLAAGAGEVYQPVLRRYLGAIAEHRPVAAKEHLERVFYIFHMAVLSILVHSGTAQESAAPPGAREIDALVSSMVDLFASGT